MFHTDHLPIGFIDSNEDLLLFFVVFYTGEMVQQTGSFVQCVELASEIDGL